MLIPISPRVWMAALACIAVVSVGHPVTTQTPSLKVFISVDLEGVTGVIQPSQLGPEGFEYGRARAWMTAEANAAIASARRAGATDIVVADSHGNAQSLLIDQLPDDVRVVRGFPRALGMMGGLDASFDAAIFIGYHSSEYTVDSVRSHTFSSARLLGVRLNGTEVSEGIFNAALAGHFEVPAVFISGDRAAVEQLQRVLPRAGGAIVKEGLGYHAAITVTPERGRQLIDAGVELALRHLGDMPVYQLRTPITLDVGFKLTIDAEHAAFVPGLTRIDAHTVRGQFPDMVAVSNVMRVLTNMAQP